MEEKRRQGILLLLLLSFLSACGTITHGSTQKIRVSSEPPGAWFTLAGEQGFYRTPCEVELWRGRDHLLQFEALGYEPTTVLVEHVLSGAIAGNVLLGSTAGLILDNTTGAQFRLVPETVTVVLKPEQPETAARDSGESSKARSPAPPEDRVVTSHFDEIRANTSVSAKVKAVADLYNQGKISKEERNRLQAAILRGKM